MATDYSFSQNLSRSKSKGGASISRPSLRTPNTALGLSGEYQNQKRIAVKDYSQGKQNRQLANNGKLNPVDELGTRMKKLLEQLRLDNAATSGGRNPQQNTRFPRCHSQSAITLPKFSIQSATKAKVSKQGKITQSFQKETPKKLYHEQKSSSYLNINRKTLASLDYNQQKQNHSGYKPKYSYEIQSYSQSIVLKQNSMDKGREWRNGKQTEDKKYAYSDAMKMKVKTIQSQNGDFLEKEDNSDYSDHCSKQSHTSDVYKKFSCFGGAQTKPRENGLRNDSQNSSAYNTNGNFEDKIKQISRKIDQYQRKVGSIVVEDVRRKSNQWEQQIYHKKAEPKFSCTELNSFRKKQYAPKERESEEKPKKSTRQCQATDPHFTNNSEQAVERIMRKYLQPKQYQINREILKSESRKRQDYEVRQKHFSPLDQIKVCTPTWRNNDSPQNSFNQSFGEDTCSNGRNRDGENKNISEQIFAQEKRGFQERQKSRQYSYERQINNRDAPRQVTSNISRESIRQNERQTAKQKMGNEDDDFKGKDKSNFNKMFGGNNLKERMAGKLNLDRAQKIINKQISLDEVLRKAKKDFSKLPDSIGELNKWVILMEKLRENGLDFEKEELSSIFYLTDDEADPFYSIQIDGLRQFQEIVGRAVREYFSAEGHFANDLIQSFTLEETSSMLGEGREEVRLDEFTILMSTFTRSSLMCRDTVMLFRRFCALSQDNRVTRQSLWDCLMRKD